MMNKYLKSKNLCLFCIFFIILMCLLVYSQQGNAKSEKVSDTSKQASVEKDSHQDESEEYSQQNETEKAYDTTGVQTSVEKDSHQDKNEEKTYLENISSYLRWTAITVTALSITIGIITVFVGGVLIFFERKRDNYEKYKLEVSEKLKKFEEDNREKLKELEENNKDSLKSHINKIDDEISQKLKERLVRKFDMKIEELEEDHEIYRQSLLKKIENAVHPIEMRHNAADTVRWQAWYKFHPPLSKALREEKWDDFLSIWSKLQEFQFILASLLSPKQKIISDGLGNFVSEKFSNDMIPDELWNLILILNDQERFKKPYVSLLLEKLGEKLGRTLDEPLPFTEDGKY